MDYGIDHAFTFRLDEIPLEKNHTPRCRSRTAAGRRQLFFGAQSWRNTSSRAAAPHSLAGEAGGAARSALGGRGN